MGDFKDLNTLKSLALALLTYEGGDLELSKEQMNQYLGQCERWIGKFTTVWGPAYHQIKKPLIQGLRREPSIDSMSCIVQDQDNPTDYYIAIRGTNPRNLSEWIFQDFWVGAMVPWDMVPYEGIIPPPQPSLATPAVSFGTNIAFSLLVRHLKDKTSGIGIDAFLWDQAKKAEKSGQKIAIHLTGHSLGGALASTLALYLNENWSDVILKPELFSYNYAGPTAGNQDFADLSIRILGERYKRYANDLDVVTQVWNRASMEKLPVLYNEPQIPMSHLLLKVLYDFAIPAIHDKKYTQIAEYQVIQSKVVPIFNRYVTQMVFQHLIPYIAELIRVCDVSDQTDLINQIDSWEVFKSFKNSKPLVRFKNKDLQYFLNLLD